jgi:hypothetical protein
MRGSFLFRFFCHHHLQEFFVVNDSIIIVIDLSYKFIDLGVSEGLILRL